MSLRDEVTTLLQALLRADTVNPPGNEIRAAEVLRAYFAGNGIEAEFYARDPDRPNVVARLRGGDGPSLAFLSHTDTVVADPAEWQRDPWSGELVDGEVWGRGALDMKDQAAASAVAFASLVREGFEPAGDLIFVSVADEEVGGVGGKGGYGLSWLVETHPDAVRCDYAINEGGGERLVLGGKPVYVCAAAEKMSAPFTVTVQRKGRARVDARDRRQRARQGGALSRCPRALRAAAGADPGGEGSARSRAGRCPSPRSGTRQGGRASTRCCLHSSSRCSASRSRRR